MSEPIIQTLPIAQWHAIAREGIHVPVTIRLAGWSMQPLLRRNQDPVTVMPLSRPLQVGDIVLFLRHDGVYVMHRVFRLLPGGVITMGDRAVVPDRPMPLSQVLGLAVSAQRGPLKLNLDSPASRLYGRFWMAIRPLRAVPKILRCTASRLKHALFGTKRAPTD